MKKTILISVLFSCSLAFGLQKEVVETRKAIQVVQNIRKAAKQVNIDENLLLAICWIESNHRLIGAVSDGATPSYGICQVKLATAEFMDEVYKHHVKATPKRLLDSYINAFYAAKYLRYQLIRYQGDINKAIEAYNKGYAVKGSGKYVRKVLNVLNKNGE